MTPVGPSEPIVADSGRVAAVARVADAGPGIAERTDGS
jgi:hypothetical protein